MQWPFCIPVLIFWKLGDSKSKKRCHEGKRQLVGSVLCPSSLLLATEKRTKMMVTIVKTRMVCKNVSIVESILRWKRIHFPVLLFPLLLPWTSELPRGWLAFASDPSNDLPASSQHYHFSIDFRIRNLHLSPHPLHDFSSHQSRSLFLPETF